MSGCTGNDRIASREDFKEIHKTYVTSLLRGFPGFVDVAPTGSYNSDITKTTFGDMDLVVHIDYTCSDILTALVEKELKTKTYSTTLVKRVIKKALANYLTQYSLIKPFVSEKHKGKRYYNAGELITVSFQDTKPACQIDNMIAITEDEFNFKKNFLNLSAEKQGLMLGLVKTIFIENSQSSIESIIDIPLPILESGEELEFTLSSRCLSLRKVSYDGTKLLGRSDLHEFMDFDIIIRLLKDFDFNKEFEDIVNNIDFTYERSVLRVIGIFDSMITIKSGEVGTPKGARKTFCSEYLKEILL
jgi:hypothetical protein